MKAGGPAIVEPGLCGLPAVQHGVPHLAIFRVAIHSMGPDAPSRANRNHRTRAMSDQRKRTGYPLRGRHPPGGCSSDTDACPGRGEAVFDLVRGAIPAKFHPLPPPPETGARAAGSRPPRLPVPRPDHRRGAGLQPISRTSPASRRPAPHPSLPCASDRRLGWEGAASPTPATGLRRRHGRRQADRLLRLTPPMVPGAPPPTPPRCSARHPQLPDGDRPPARQRARPHAAHPEGNRPATRPCADAVLTLWRTRMLRTEEAVGGRG